jgi:hypothetical protein
MIMNGGGCGGGAVRPFPSCGGSAVDRETAACWPPSPCLIPVLWPTLLPTALPSSIDHTVICCQPSHCRHPRCFTPPSMPPLSAINTHVVVATLSSPMLLSAAAAAAAAATTTAVFAAIAAAFWLIVVCGPCLVRYLPPPLPCSSSHLTTSSSHSGRWRQTMPTPVKPMPGGHWVVHALLHWRPSPLAATACSLRCCCRLCHLHSPRRRQNDWRRRQQSTTTFRQPHHLANRRRRATKRKV